jgi:Pregnancy-associated plasma protein-A
VFAHNTNAAQTLLLLLPTTMIIIVDGWIFIHRYHSLTYCWVFFVVVIVVVAQHTVLGLLHTFAGDSCNDGLIGDGVADTPQHRKPDLATPMNDNDECDNAVIMDSCVTLPGMDPVQNFMTYRRDNTCRTHFTTGQVERMDYQWHLYRAPVHDDDDDDPSATLWTSRPSATPVQCAGLFGGCAHRDCCHGHCWRGLLFGLLPDFCFL